ncbi:hormogonium polysaccharide biosynthesis protein HpsA [Trichocoleus sp. DQ-U1]|uniref:hormogonium polysaccharide biosynthesis protein HpsA n=1 Tax=Trichocoleus sp. DQ-U1 TaxID=2933926 RepID=UPI00329854A4
MSSRNKLVKAIQNLVRQMMQLARVITKTLMNWLLRSLMVIGRSSKLAKSGFILPTVTMVILVVILLTTAMVFRSFDRSKNASNIRVSQATLAAATPALDRAKAKISALLTDPTLPRATPTDIALTNAIAGNIKKYTLGDETPLVVQYDFGNGTGGLTSDGSIQSLSSASNKANSLENDERSTTAWRFPVDTDNNGTPDSYTLYGIYFRTPLTRTKRAAVDSRTPPMDDSATNQQCAAAQGNFAGLVGSSGWNKSGAVLKKSFYVFAATVPHTPPEGTPPNPGMERYTGNRGFTAIEYQQDRAQIPLSNNAVVYEDDLEITPGSGLKLNGRIQTNSNLITNKAGSGDVEYYQVSSYKSCFFQEENGKITVGGNVLVGGIGSTSTGSVFVDLFKNDKTVNRQSLATGNQSVSNTPDQAGYNSQAFANRIDILAKNTAPGKEPKEVLEKIPATASPETKEEIRLDALKNYFKDRMPRVPFAENATADSPTTAPEGNGDTPGNPLRPPAIWINPFAGTKNLTLQPSKPPATEPTQQKQTGTESRLGDRILVGNGLPATWWNGTSFVGSQEKQQVDTSTKWDGSSELRYRTTQIVPLSDLGNTDRDGFWEEHAAKPPSQPLDGWGGLRVVTGAGVYTGVRVGSTPPPTAAELPSASFLPPPKPGVAGSLQELQVPDDTSTTNINESKFTVVWPDTMPMWDDTNKNGLPDLEPVDRRGDLVMRATAVYHYKKSAAAKITDNQTPIACVSNYYDPSTSLTAKNRPLLAPSFAGPPGVTGTTGRSNNGISYPPPTAPRPTTSAAPDSTTGLFPVGLNPNVFGPIIERLYYQANLIFPNGRFVNEPLRDALTALSKPNAALTISQQSAIDATMCSLQILGGGITPSNAVIPHGTIYETSFLDARQVKAIDKDEAPGNDAVGGLATFRALGPGNGTTLTGKYNLPVEERQPLEIRATVLDLSKLRTTTVTGTTVAKPDPEYLLPNSGIIYATRDDALPDLSEPWPTTGSTAQRNATRKAKSPVDFKLDPTRRPNGIMLVNGSILARGAGNTNTYNLVDPPGAEKGLILATNLPAYVKADSRGFNLHSSSATGQALEEFDDVLLSNVPTYNNTTFYSRQDPEDDFGCRKGQPGIPCPNGDLWRQATVLADSVSLLSDSFRFGFRNEGDYDLRNNQGYLTSINQRKEQGFLDNNFVTNGLSSGATIIAPAGNGINPTPVDKIPTDFTYAQNNTTSPIPPNYVPSSYFNNFVTPIQRRGSFPEYLMEVCTKLPVTECTPADWYIDPTPGSLKKASDKTVGGTYKFIDQALDISNTHKAGTTAKPAPQYQRYARRVAFLRDDSDNLVNDTGSAITFPPPLSPPPTPAAVAAIAANLVPLGIDNSGNIRRYPYSGTTVPAPANNALWFKTTSTPATPNNGASYSTSNRLFIQEIPSTAQGQPLLAPILQIHLTNQSTITNPNSENIGTAGKAIANNTLWLHRPSPNTGTTFNLLIAGGDSPSRPGESNGGLQNFVRFIENWKAIPARINGSFIQFNRSATATAPLTTAKSATPPVSPFGYNKLYASEISKVSDAVGGSTAFYVEPLRYWGFDVGLLSQQPDLFSQRFTTPDAGAPNEFYREVARDDEWVKTLLCAKLPPTTPTANPTTPAIDANQRPEAFCTAKTGG